MKTMDVLQVLLYLTIIILFVPLLGGYMKKVFLGEKHILQPTLGWLERITYRFSGVDANVETNWKKYLFQLLAFNLIGFAFVFMLQLTQSELPLNPSNLANVNWHSSFNTAVSFMTNTNWQGYAGETTLSSLVQMIGLTVQNFVSAATGIAVLLALVRGLTRKNTDQLGNFWVDLTRSTLYVLLPLSILLAVALVGQGVIQNFNNPVTAHTLEGGSQLIPGGPVASQIAIKQLGTNGGGFFNANSAHPFENPTPFSNWLEMLALLLIPAALTYTYGKMVGSTKQGWTLFLTMFLLLTAGLVLSLSAEYSPHGILGNLPLMEG